MAFRFEKSLYDLIKGLRNHKGSEDEYVQGCLRECKAEIKSQDTGMFIIIHHPPPMLVERLSSKSRQTRRQLHF